MAGTRRLLVVLIFAALPAAAQEPAPPAAKAPAKKAAKSGAASKTPAKAAAAKAAPAVALKTQKDKLSYAIGMNISQSLKAQSVELDYDLILQGMKDGLSGAKPMLSEAEITATLKQGQQEAMAKQQEMQKAAGEKNKREGEAFLAANKSKPGVVTLPSGLQYQEITPGTGATPKASDTVTTHYRGTLIDGTEFDSSYKRGEPASFPVTGVIKGWTEALQLMKVGAKWKLFIPAGLAYGEQQRGPVITPNSVLVFDIELLAIKEPPAAKQPQKLP